MTIGLFIAPCLVFFVPGTSVTVSNLGTLPVWRSGTDLSEVRLKGSGEEAIPYLQAPTSYADKAHAKQSKVEVFIYFFFWGVSTSREKSTSSCTIRQCKHLAHYCGWS